MLEVVSSKYRIYLQVKCWYRIINNTYNCKTMFLKSTGHNYRFIVRKSVILYNYVKKRCISFAVNVIHSPKGYQLDLSVTLKKAQVGRTQYLESYRPISHTLNNTALSYLVFTSISTNFYAKSILYGIIYNLKLLLEIIVIIILQNHSSIFPCTLF